MTGAEQLRAMGREEGLAESREKNWEKGREEAREEIAINSLKEGFEPRFVSRITGLELAVILKLKLKLKLKLNCNSKIPSVMYSCSVLLKYYLVNQLTKILTQINDLNGSPNIKLFDIGYAKTLGPQK